ncbi:MAG TPA: GNAT family N-acetyltransferase [Patescibacteria group bacterium]|nr:GNAT family N-acetyltransferase [Patescibacteria group bacterium]
MSYEILTLQKHPELQSEVDQFAAYWPPFMLQEQYSKQYWESLKYIFPDYQYAMIDPTSGEVVARGLSLPIAWDHTNDGLPTGWGQAHELAFEQYKTGKQPNTLCALEITLKPELRGLGLSRRMIEAMKEIAKSHGFDNLIAPVRPSLKSQYPLISIEAYLQRTMSLSSDEPFDPWIGIHWRLGAKILKLAPASMTVEDTVAQWKRWTDINFPTSGLYVVKGALVPVDINLENDRGTYVEPNVWMLHSINT